MSEFETHDKNNENNIDTDTSQIHDKENGKKSRKDKNSNLGTWIVAALAVLALTISASLYLSRPKNVATEVESRSVTLTDVGFDTPVTLQTTCTEDEFARYLGIVKDTFTECATIFDAVNEQEDGETLKTKNRLAHDGPVEVDEKLIEVLNDSKEVHDLNIKFDPSQGKLTALWRDAMNAYDESQGTKAKLPGNEEIEASINPDSLSAVEVDGNTIRLTNEEAALDFGAIAKGYTAQLCADRLKEAGMEFGFLNAGGNVVLIGNKPDGSSWKIGIQEPDGNESLVVLETPTPTCLVTSGDYQRYMTIDGKRYAHIIDPTTGYPAEYMRSVTVVNPDSAYCDGMSTALFCMSVEEGMALCEKLDLDAVWITDAGSLEKTPDFSTDQFDVYTTPGIKDQINLK